MPRLLPALAAALALGGCGGDDPASHPAPPASTVPGSAGLRAVEVASGLDRPVHVAFAPGEAGRLYVVGQAGRVDVVEGGRVRSAPFLDIRRLTSTSPRGEVASERGLLSLAFAPDYAASGRLAVHYTDRRGAVNVVEYTARDGRADPASARRLLLVPKESDAHNGGQVAFGPDGALYAGIGDDAGPREHPQSLEPGDPLGKVVRLDPRTARPRPRVVAYGLRNPWRFSFDRATGELWIGDVGELGWEEVTRLPRPAGGPPANLGWPAYEGHEAITWDGDWEEPRGPGRLTWPVAVYAREGGCAAVVGGHVYRGRAVPALRGRYLFGDFCTGTVWSLDPARPREVRTELELGTTLASFGEDAAGELYLVSRTGTVFRLAG